MLLGGWNLSSGELLQGLGIHTSEDGAFSGESAVISGGEGDSGAGSASVGRTANGFAAATGRNGHYHCQGEEAGLGGCS